MILLVELIKFQRQAASPVRDFGNFAPTTNLSSSNTWSGIDSTNAFVKDLNGEMVLNGEVQIQKQLQLH